MVKQVKRSGMISKKEVKMLTPAQEKEMKEANKWIKKDLAGKRRITTHNK